MNSPIIVEATCVNVLDNFRTPIYRTTKFNKNANCFGFLPDIAWTNPFLLKNLIN